MMKTNLLPDRLRLEPLSLDDADILVELFTDPVFKKHTSGAQSEAAMATDYIS